MRNLIVILIGMSIVASSCKKDQKLSEEKEVIIGNVKQAVEKSNGIAYKLFTDINTTSFKGILVLGSGNDENNPSEGSTNGAAENALCQKAANNGYAAAIVKYQKPPAGADWNARAKLLGEDFDRAIVAISQKYGIDKSKAVVGGISYTTFMLFTDITNNNTLTYTKGVLGACGASGSWNAQNFKIPIFAINCSGNFEGNYNGKALYDLIPVGSPIKAKSEGITDNTCSGHCNGNWTDRMYNKMVAWLQ